ncbi:type II toxin-antitoxin system ParD family antitoxin [Nostoc sp. FACHB-152]|uniref:type II toxin-antitoxin system ParD family antitoxin n=1 Tax=unclassified Nostoc TaxID=2593658 RepID=UPI001689270E|nr:MULTISPECIES: type II toxin-antitoxin system ParD family antitoxin [unclassified Nostoc]MBD2447129.1 type II toxin-antitoxin system ParD family antitoxin [Nostoc sp. FACHB-152]MBD2469193.1 type II toxin-antitoxin system ParD family antitoxin [Nostoc sp. FACHB-145]
MNSILLTSEQKKLVQNLLATGKFNDVGEVIQAALSLLEQETLAYQAWVEETRILIDEGIASLENGEGIDGETFVNHLLTDLQKIKESQK